MTQTTLLASIGSYKAILPLFGLLLKLGAKKHVSSKLIHSAGKTAKELAKEKVEDAVSDAVQKKDDKEKKKEE